MRLTTAQKYGIGGGLMGLGQLFAGRQPQMNNPMIMQGLAAQQEDEKTKQNQALMVKYFGGGALGTQTASAAGSGGGGGLDIMQHATPQQQAGIQMAIEMGDTATAMKIMAGIEKPKDKLMKVWDTQTKSMEHVKESEFMKNRDRYDAAAPRESEGLPAGLRAERERLKRMGWSDEKIDQALANKAQFSGRTDSLGRPLIYDEYNPGFRGQSVGVEFTGQEQPQPEGLSVDPNLATGGASGLGRMANTIGAIAEQTPAPETAAATNYLETLYQETSLAVKTLEGRDSKFSQQQIGNIMPKPTAFTSDDDARDKADRTVETLQGWLADIDAVLLNQNIGDKAKEDYQAARPQFERLLHKWQLWRDSYDGGGGSMNTDDESFLEEMKKKYQGAP